MGVGVLYVGGSRAAKPTQAAAVTVPGPQPRHHQGTPRPRSLTPVLPRRPRCLMWLLVSQHLQPSMDAKVPRKPPELPPPRPPIAWVLTWPTSFWGVLAELVPRGMQTR